ncbi:MAG: ferredoxin [Steroidobacteraceae bacterium]
MKIIANKQRCSGHARCAAMAEQLFELDDNGYIGFTTKVVQPGEEETARRGVRACPERALKLVDDGTEIE